MFHDSSQNSVKVSEVRHTADTREAREEQTRIIENKLFIAERNRTKEMEKRLENIRKHVGWATYFFISTPTSLSLTPSGEQNKSRHISEFLLFILTIYFVSRCSLSHEKKTSLN